MLGLQGYTFDKANPRLLKGVVDGKEVSFDVFQDVVRTMDVTAPQLERLLNYLHRMGELDFSTYIDNISYQGFDRLFYIRMALKKVSVSQFSRFAIMGAIRGSNFKKIVDSSISVPQDLITLVSNGTVIKNAKKRDDLTILRFTASIPHWVAFWLFGAGVPKKISSLECPSCIQFPGAASLPMGKKQRLLHIEFCMAFSALLPGGSFNRNIYYTAYSNPIDRSAIPTAIKAELGIAEGDDSSGTISSTEVNEVLSKQLVKT